MPNPDKELTVEECPVESALFRIKPLEWRWFDDKHSRGWRVANNTLFDSEVYQYKELDGEWVERWRYYTSHVDDTDYCASPEEGKQLAEQHWQAYIKQALIEDSQQ